MVLAFTGVSLLLLTGVMLWGATNGWLTRRYNDYYDAVRAAEAATEKVIAHVSRDFQQSGFTGVNNNLGSYGALVPTSAESGVTLPFAFSDPLGSADRTYVQLLSGPEYSDLKWRYSGFPSSNASYRIVSNARTTGGGNSVVGALKQDVQIAAIPLFAFGVFYGLDLEINPGADFQVSGRVHCNGTIYCEPAANLSFTDHVTASGSIRHEAHPEDSSSRIFGSVTYAGEHDGSVTSLNLPLGQSADPATLHQIIEIPDPSESPSSPLGQQRYYNKADLVIKVYETNIVAHSGAYDGFNTPVPWSAISNFVITNFSWANFFDRREQKTVEPTGINVRKLRDQQSALNDILPGPGNVKILYIADLRPTNSTTLRAIFVHDAQTLPTDGLTVVTMNPLYLQGHFNAPDITPGLTNTSPRSGSLVADAITIWSVDWDNGNPATPVADPTTVNAAILAGIVASTNGVYSGGLENFFRLLENWNGRTLTFNGSMVVLFPSQIATAPWSDDPNIYRRPIRAYSFDANFKDPARLPPGTPEVRTLIRSEWAMTQPNSTQ